MYVKITACELLKKVQKWQSLSTSKFNYIFLIFTEITASNFTNHPLDATLFQRSPQFLVNMVLERIQI